MKSSEKVSDYFSSVMTVANRMMVHGERMVDVTIVEKILQSLTDKFNYIVCSIEESKDIDNLSIDELQNSLIVHEQKFHKHDREEQALKVTHEDRSGGRRRGQGSFRGRGRGRVRGRQFFDKSVVECYKCHKLGHFQYECPSWDKEANYAELDEKEKMLLMSFVELNEARRGDVWFLDSGCSNHMCGDKTLFSSFNESFRQTVKLGNNTKMSVVGKGNVRLQVSEFMHVLTDVFYVPELRNNLLSIGQLQEKGLAILIQHGKCWIYHPEKGLIIQTEMSANRIFFLLVRSPPRKAACFYTTSQDWDVKFEEDKCWDWDKSYKELIAVDLECGDNEGEAAISDVIEEDSEGDNDAEEVETISSSNVNDMNSPSSNEGRSRRRPVWMDDYESGEGFSEKDVANMLADVMTKALKLDTFQKLRDQLGVCQVPKVN
ncbi:hypothetical protein LWI28_009895 [Acer negundo]|uniref:CCHC-type domain-containing protein n=1 Tax=Acer negundo TaxID=4023 RepID=A0AAD5IE27_ACENE|nr:hypothetical protein LWI28_009895 [Acer negundo]